MVDWLDGHQILRDFVDNIYFFLADFGPGKSDDLICCKGTIPVRYRGIEAQIYWLELF